MHPLNYYSQYKSGDAAGYRRLQDSQNISNSLTDDEDLYSLDFYLLNLTQCNEFHYIKKKYPDYVDLDFETISESLHQKENHLITNVDYTYNFMVVSKNNTLSYIEYLVNISEGSIIDKIMSFMKSLFICFVLIIVSYQFRQDLINKVMIPTIKIIKKFRYFFHMDTLSYCELVISDDKVEEELILYKKLGLLSYYFDLTVGKRILGLISQDNNYMNTQRFCIISKIKE